MSETPTLLYFAGDGRGPSIAELVARVCDDQRARWRQGERGTLSPTAATCFEVPYVLIDVLFSES